MKTIKNDPATYRTRASLAAAKKRLVSALGSTGVSEEILSLLREANPLGYVALPQSAYPRIKKEKDVISFSQKLLILQGG